VGKTLAGIDAALAEWLLAQPVFFVATAPLAQQGHVNCSPKGGASLRVLGPHAVAWIDGAGSGIETVSHLRENGRIVLMWCAFDGAPRIVRLHGRGDIVTPNQPQFAALLAQFGEAPSVRSIVRVSVARVSDSCGYGVPLMDFRGIRPDSARYVARASDSTLKRYLRDNNSVSIDGLPGLTSDEIEGAVFRR
jgi:hypothetical protein